MIDYKDGRKFAVRTIPCTVAVMLAAGLMGARQAHAQTALPPGTTADTPVPIITTGTPPFGDTLLQEVQSAVFATNGPNTISGTVTSAAFLNTSGFLDFTYQVAFGAPTNVIVDALSLTSFKGVAGVAVGQTSEDVDGPGGLAAQNMSGTIQNNFTLATSTASFVAASRNNTNGDGINVNFSYGVTGNQSSFTFVVRTNATSYTTNGSASVQGGGISSFTPAHGVIAPVAAAPEPGALSLLSVGIFAAVGSASRRKQRS